MVSLLTASLYVADVYVEFGGVLEFVCLCCLRNTAATLCVVAIAKFRGREIWLQAISKTLA